MPNRNSYSKLHGMDTAPQRYDKNGIYPAKYDSFVTVSRASTPKFSFVTKASLFLKGRLCNNQVNLIENL